MAPNRIDTRADSALKSSAAALVVCVACAAMFLPPMVNHTVASVLRTVLTSLTLCAAMLLHWVFLGIAAKRLHRSVAGWLALAVLLFPVGSAAALVLLGWFREEAAAPAATA